MNSVYPENSRLNLWFKHFGARPDIPIIRKVNKVRKFKLLIQLLPSVCFDPYNCPAMTSSLDLMRA